MGKHILVTGANSGLGKHCLYYFSALGFSRETCWDDILKCGQVQPFDAIIHAAFNTRKDITSANLDAYLEDTFYFTQKLSKVPHHKFIFISSSDVYPKNNQSHNENETIAVSDLDDIYAVSKVMCEAIVKKECEDCLILRPSALLGKFAKKNSLMKILANEPTKLSLSAQSSFNYLLHEDISHFIEIALEKNLRGIYNLAAAKNISLQQIVEIFSIKPRFEFGDFTYRTGDIDNCKAKAFFPELDQDSADNITRFQKDISMYAA